MKTRNNSSTSGELTIYDIAFLCGVSVEYARTLVRTGALDKPITKEKCEQFRASRSRSARKSSPHARRVLRVERAHISEFDALIATLPYVQVVNEREIAKQRDARAIEQARRKWQQ